MKILLGIGTIILIFFGIPQFSNIEEQGGNSIDTNIAQEENEEKFIIDEGISFSSYAYDFTNKKVIKDVSDLIIIGKVKDIEKVSNYVEKLDQYGATRTYANIDNIQVLYQTKESKINHNITDESTMQVVFYGGILPYREYEKSLEDAQREKRESLMNFGKNKMTKDNTYIRTREQNQIEIEEGKEYLLYLVYDENYEAFMPVSAEHGVMEYDPLTKNVKNHIEGKVEKLDERLILN